MGERSVLQAFTEGLPSSHEGFAPAGCAGRAATECAGRAANHRASRADAGSCSRDSEPSLFGPEVVGPDEDVRIVCAGDDSADDSDGEPNTLFAPDVLGDSREGAEGEGEDEVTCLVGGDDVSVRRAGARGWNPGRDCAGWVDNKTQPLSAQSRALVVNTIVNFEGMPRAALRAVALSLRVCWTKVRQSGVGAVTACAAWTLGLSPARVHEVYAAAKANRELWTPEVVADSSTVARADEIAAARARKVAEDERKLRNHVRLALAARFEGRSCLEFERDAVRLAVAEADGVLTATWLPGRKFARIVGNLGVLVMQQLDAHDFNDVLPGLGIPSDVAMVADPVAIGTSVMSRHDVALVTCLALVSARNGLVYNPMHSADLMPVGAHSGSVMAEMWVSAFAQHPASWGWALLQARLAAVGGDGGLCAGGVDHRHQSSAAVEQLWRRLFPAPDAPVCATWDPFHRVDNAVWRAIRGCELVLGVFDISKEMDNLFGVSEGVLILRGVAEALGDTGVRKIKAPGGTRKIVYLTGVPGHLIANFFALYNALWARVAWKQAGHSTQKLRHILDLAGRFAAPKTVVTMIMLEDILARVVQPLARQVQKHVEPVLLSQAQTASVSRIAVAAAHIRKFRVLLRVISLLRQHLGSHDLGCFFGAFNTGAARSLFPSFFAHVREIIGPTRSFRGVGLLVPDAHDPSQDLFLGAHCQCPDVVAARAGALADRGRPPRTSARGQARPPRSFRVDEDFDWVGTPPRCRVFPAAARLPAGLDSRGMFRHGLRDGTRGGPCAPGCRNTRRGRASWDGSCPCGWSSACIVSRQAFLVDCAVDDGLAAVAAFLDALRRELSAIFGTVGANDDRISILAHAARCWDWSRLAQESPTVPDVRAFDSLTEILRPCLSHTLFPHLGAFAAVDDRWLTDRAWRGRQYMLLCRRVRAAAATAAAAVRGQRLQSGSAAKPAVQTGCAGEPAVRSLGIRVPRDVCAEARRWFSGVSSYVVKAALGVPTSWRRVEACVADPRLE